MINGASGLSEATLKNSDDGSCLNIPNQSFIDFSIIFGLEPGTANSLLCNLDLAGL